MGSYLRGIVVENNSQARTGGAGQRQIKVSAIELRYKDGHRFAFIPEARNEYFGQDEVLMVADRMLKASQEMEWNETNNQLSM